MPETSSDANPVPPADLPGSPPPPPLNPADLPLVNFSDTPEVFQVLDPRVIGLWRLTKCIGFAVVGLLLSIPLASVALLVPGGWISVALVVAFLGGLLVWFGYFRPARLYRRWSYRIDEKVLELRYGNLFRVRRLIPLSRLQHVDLHRGPLERKFGLASLVLYTAGTHAAIHGIPGLDAEEAVRLRDRLIELGGDDVL